MMFKGEFFLNSKVDICVFSEIICNNLWNGIFEDNYFHNYKLLAENIKYKESKKWNDSNFIWHKTVKQFVQHKQTNNIYMLEYTFKKTIKNEAFEINKVKTITDNQFIKNLKKSDRVKKILALTRVEKDIVLNVYITTLKEDEVYKYVEYTCYNYNI